MDQHFISVNGIQLRYFDTGGTKPLLVLLHGLTANAHAFCGLWHHGLADHYRLVAPDLRGRGESDKPAFGYAYKDHAADILGLLDHLAIDSATIGGHSYGGLLSVYLAARYPEKVSKLVLLDAAMEMNTNVMEMLTPTLARLDTTYPSLKDFLEEMKRAPQNTLWDKDLETYYKADAFVREDGTVNPRSNLTNILEAATGTAAEPWAEHFSKARQPAILLNALDDYTMGQPLLPDFKARETAELMNDCAYKGVGGNHQTMLFGTHAQALAASIHSFLA